MTFTISLRLKNKIFVCRITSYNVCYTKLLRVVFQQFFIGFNIPLGDFRKLVKEADVTGCFRMVDETGIICEIEVSAVFHIAGVEQVVQGVQILVLADLQKGGNTEDFINETIVFPDNGLRRNFFCGE